MSSKQSVALFGGAFDPITLGHEITIQAIHAQTGFDVWVMPCFGHRFGKRLASSNHRINMCGEITCKDGYGYRWATTSDFEIANHHNGSSYELLTQLKQSIPDILFHLAVGADNFLIMAEKWDRGKELIEENPLIVIGRPGYDVDPTTIKSPHTYIDLRFPSLSSTKIRQAIAEGKYDLAARNLDFRVWQYIRQNQLYGYKEKNHVEA